MNRIIATIVSVLLILSACSASKQRVDYARQDVNLAGKWNLIQIQDKAGIDTLKMREQAYIILDAEEHKITGSTGCNNFFGTYSEDDSKISFGPTGSTKIYCENVPEQEFFDALENTTSFSIKDGVLRFFNDEKLMMQFIRSTE